MPVGFEGLPPEADGLFASDDFVAERDRLVNRLRAEGNKDAAAVAKLRKLPKLVTAINRAAQELPEQALAATTAAEELAAAQAGGDRRQLATTLARLHETVDRLVDRAISDGGDRAAAYRLVQAALTSPQGRQAIAHGRLAELPEPAGFDALAGMEITTQPRPTTNVSDAGSRRTTTQKQRDAERRRELAQELSAAKGSLRQAERQEKLAQAAHDAASRRVEAIEAALKQLARSR
jgi:hypothetical protein